MLTWKDLTEEEIELVHEKTGLDNQNKFLYALKYDFVSGFSGSGVMSGSNNFSVNTPLGRFSLNNMPEEIGKRFKTKDKKLILMIALRIRELTLKIAFDISGKYNLSYTQMVKHSLKEAFDALIKEIDPDYVLS